MWQCLLRHRGGDTVHFGEDVAFRRSGRDAPGKASGEISRDSLPASRSDTVLRTVHAKAKGERFCHCSLFAGGAHKLVRIVSAVLPKQGLHAVGVQSFNLDKRIVPAFFGSTTALKGLVKLCLCGLWADGIERDVISGLAFVVPPTGFFHVG